MSKVALFTDPHFGIKDGDDKWLSSQITFFEEEFLPYLIENDIKDIICLGDLFNDREITKVVLNADKYEIYY